MEGDVVTAGLLRGWTPHCEGGSGSGSSVEKHSKVINTTQWAFSKNTALTGWTFSWLDLGHPHCLLRRRHRRKTFL